MEVDLEEFAKQQSIKWLRLPEAETRYLVEELSKREGVFVKELAEGESFQFHGPGKMLVIEDPKKLGL